MTEITPHVAEELGPLVQLARLGHAGASLGAWLTAPQFTQQLDQIAKRESWFSGDHRQGVLPVRSILKDQNAWHNFSIKAKNAATAVGVHQQEAYQLLASIEEIYTNVIEHSQAPDTGVIAYSCRPGSFEYVVCDDGIGVLQSLKRNPQFASLSDAGAALELALSDGVSSKAEAGRGMGFRPLFVGLANISRMVRFYSDDYARTLTRQADGALPAETLQRAQTDGLFCSVLLEADRLGSN